MPGSIHVAYTFGNAVRGQYCNSMVSRAYRRVRMRLAARRCWTSPFGQKIELVETKDVSREWLLLSSRDRHAPSVPVWVTFPYDASLREGQPEVLAGVVPGGELSAASLHFTPIRGHPEKVIARQSCIRANFDLRPPPFVRYTEQLLKTLPGRINDCFP